MYYVFYFHCSLQKKTNKKVVLWQGNRTYVHHDAVVKFDTYRNTTASRGSPCNSMAAVYCRRVAGHFSC